MTAGSRQDPHDPKGLIRESFRIEGITDGECRSIFLDWAIGLPGDGMLRSHIVALLERHGAGAPDHPMTAVLRAGLDAPDLPRRRGGRKGRVG